MDYTLLQLGVGLKLHFFMHTQSFLVWKFPARIHGHNKVVQPSAKDWKYVTERFYDDYIDTQNSK